jgi:uncharacterized protein
MTGAVAYRLPDGRLHLQHGPIDLICEGWGHREAVEAGYMRAWQRFDGLLEELVAELAALRSEDMPLIGPIAQTMGRAVAPFRPRFITPMAAVAGAVAEAVLDALVGHGISRAYINNGGDIALHLGAGQAFSCALAGGQDLITVQYQNNVRGIATSGWRGRSWSFGIADSVSVLARTASMADAAATMIANAVNLPGHPAIARQPAHDLQADSDLGARLVTVGVGRFTRREIETALAAGAAAAQAYRANGLIESAALFLQGEIRIVGPFAVKEAAVA